MKNEQENENWNQTRRRQNSLEIHEELVDLKL
jgi:hypothetical protein